jgi:hypothetical protein
MKKKFFEKKMDEKGRMMNFYSRESARRFLRIEIHHLRHDNPPLIIGDIAPRMKPIEIIVL